MTTKLREVTRVPGETAYWILDVTLTQTNAAGGLMVLRVTCPEYTKMVLCDGRITNSGNNGLYSRKRTSANALTTRIVAVGAAAGTVANMPSQGSNASSSDNNADSRGFEIIGGEALDFGQTAAGAQNDTMRVQLRFELKSRIEKPTYDFALSTNAADVTQVVNLERIQRFNEVE